MTEFFEQYFCPTDDRYSVVIDGDTKVVYAYLLLGEEIITDVWLYNLGENPETIDWNNEDEEPLQLPKKHLLEDKLIDPVTEEEEVKCKWKRKDGALEVRIYIRGEYIALLKPGSSLGWSTLVKADTSLAKKLGD